MAAKGWRKRGGGKQEQGEPDLIECGNCHEGLADMEHVCKKCLGAGWVNNPKQEHGSTTCDKPMAWIHCHGNFKEAYDRPLDEDEVLRGWTQIPLYTTQQRTWVGLNWSDLPEEWVGNPAFMEGAKWAEAAFKEKNT